MAGEEEEGIIRGFLRRMTFTLIPLPLPLPLLPISNIESHPISQNLHNFEVGKLAFTLAITATTGLIFSHKFPVTDAHNFIVLGFMAACAALWNGILFQRIILQLLGITLILLCFYGLVASFLPSAFSWPCWLFATISLIPFLSLLITSLTLVRSS